MGQAKIDSPDGLELRGKPKLSARLNKKAVGIAVALIIGVMLFVMANVSKDNKPAQKKVEEEKKQQLQPATRSAETITKDVSDQPFLLPVEPPKLPKELPSANATTGTDTQVPPISATSAGMATTSHTVTSTDPKIVIDAHYADTVVTKFSDSGKEGGAAKAMLPNPSAPSVAKADSENQHKANNEEPDANKQAQKQAFLEKNAATKKPSYEIVQLDQPINEFEIKTGTVIPGVLITHVNSDLPGEIVGQVSQNVFDSSTGRFLLIPQGSKLFGRYDSAITTGQERLLVAWNRIIFPNGSTMDLSGMAGHDKGGSAGTADLVNNHYLKTFGFALLSSLFSAAFIMSQPDTQRSVFVEAPPREKAMEEVSKQITDLGAVVARRNMAIQPTIELRKGTKFTVMVNRDLVFPSAYQP